MSKILHCFLCLIFLGYTGVAMAVTGTVVTPGGGTVVTPGGGTVVGPSATTSGSYSCPTYRKYSSCKAGYYLAYSYTGTSYSSIRYYSTPRAGNACRPCTDYDTYYNKPEGSYYCAGGTERPVLNKVTITYNLNGGSGTPPASKSCTKGQTCALNQGATTSFYRAGYVFKGWALTSTATSGFTSYTFTANDTVYAVWEKCGLGEYKPGSGTRASAACSSCPELTPGFEYWRVDGLLPSSVNTCFQAVIDPGDVDSQCTSTDTSIPAIVQVAVSDDAWGTMTAAAVLAAKPGAYLNFQGSQVIPEGTDLDDICTECGVGTYSEGGDVTSCSACPELTPGFEYLPTTGNTSLTACRQGIAKAADVNEYCATSSETTEQFDIQCEATPDGTWYDCIIGNAWMAKPGSYVGIWKQEMPAEDVIENMCIQCTDGTYSEGGLINSCSSCPELIPMDEQAGWRVSSGGDGATSWNACYAYWERFPSNCASGSFKKNAVSSLNYGSEWFELEPLTAKPGYIVDFEDGQTDAPACVACTDATFSPGGDVHSCSACPPGYDANTETGKTSADECQISCDAGTYVATANAACTAVGSGYYKAAHMVNYGSTSTRDQCPSGYQNSDAGADVINDCYMNVSGGEYVETENATTTATCAAGTYKAAHTVYYGSTSSCSACTGRTKYSGAGTSACSTVDSGYYSTGCNTSGNNCTGQSQCTGATYCSGGVQYNCPAQSSGWTRNGGNGWTSYTQCNQTRAATEAWSYCSAGTLKQNATSATAWGAPTVSEALSAKAGAYVNGTTCSQCTAGDYCTGGTAARKDCPSGYPNSAAGSDAITDCYSNTKSRPWSGSQVNGTVPTNCSAVTEWGTCSKDSCDYVAYANSAGTADGTIKSGCETNAANCTKPVKAVSAKSGFYDAGTTCTECPSGYPNSDADNEGGITQCYSNTKSRPWSGGMVNGAVPTNCSEVTEWGTCSKSACEYVAYSNSAGTADGTVKSGCKTNSENCVRPVVAVAAESGYYDAGTTCTECPSGYPNSDADNEGGITQCYSDEKSRPWMGGQISCKTPAGCSDSTCNICTLPACSYVAYSNSTGSADGAIKSGCATNNEDCQQTVKSVTANAGYIVQDNDGVLTCAVCTGATYSAGGSATNCTACPSIYTDNTDSAKTNASQCQVITTGGYYIANANDDTETDCGTAYYCPSETVNYGDTNERKACPVAADHRITDYPDNFYNVVSVSAMNQSWGATNISSIGQCVAQYTVTNERGTFAAENVRYNPETEKYDVFGNHYYSKVNPGYYGNEKWSEGYCDESSRRMLYKDALPCPAGSYCPGFSNVSCGSGEYNDTLGLNSCPVAYPSSPALSSEISACYLTTTPKNFVATANAAQTTCTAGGYCVGGVKVNYGSTGGRTPASKGYYVASTGATTQTPCAVGTYTATTGQTKCTDAVAGTYTTGCGSNNTACTGTAVCANNSYSAAKASSCTACNTADGYGNSGTSAANHAGIASCKASCGGGEYVPTAGGGCVNVGVGYWGAGGTVAQDATLARNQCDSGLTTIGSGAGADEAGDCGRVLNVNGEKIYLRSTKKTTPSLNVGINGKTFYGNMGTATKGTLRINSGGTTYSVYDDSM